MNEKFRQAFISNNKPKSAGAEQNDKISKTQKRKVVIGDGPVHYPDDAMTKDISLTKIIQFNK